MTHRVLLLVLLVAQSGACPAMCTCSQHRAVCDAFPSATVPPIDHLTITNGDDLSWAQIPPQLDTLIITNSVINFNESDSDNTTSSLHHLDVSSNTLSSIPSDAFRTFSHLEVLNLSANALTLLAPESFNGLVELKCLDLSGNNLTHLEATLFEELAALQYLNLSHNHLEGLNEQCFGTLLKLQQLDVSFNQLSQLDSLQLPSLTRLLLAGNPKLGHSLLVGTGQRLQTVDASFIGLKQVPAALTRSIRTLRLASNQIKSVQCGDLDSYPLLQLLDFKSNGLETVEDDALGRLDSLSVLYLTDNSMSQIPGSLSEKLTVLHLEHNKIGRINTRDLQSLSVLEVLLLNDNNITLIEEDAFGQLNSLVTLDISHNPIKVLGSLSGSMTLQVLRLSNIDVAASEKSFPVSSMEHLITLDLSGSPTLTRLLLEDTAALAASRELQELDLSCTALEDIRSDLLHYLPQLRILHVNGNRMNCSQLQWLGAWMRRQDEPEYTKITCASPPELWGVPLIDLQEEEITSNDIPTLTTPGTTTEIMTTTSEATTVYVVVEEQRSGEPWNASKMSMAREPQPRGMLHPGLVILGLGILGTAAALVMVAARCTRRRRLQEADVEISGMPGVTELW